MPTNKLTIIKFPNKINPMKNKLQAGLKSTLGYKSISLASVLVNLNIFILKKYIINSTYFKL